MEYKLRFSKTRPWVVERLVKMIKEQQAEDAGEKKEPKPLAKVLEFKRKQNT